MTYTSSFQGKQVSSDSILRHTSTSSSDDQADHKRKSRSVTFSIDKPTAATPSPSVSDGSSNGVSERARRSLRRQAKSGKQSVKKGSIGKKDVTKRSGLRSTKMQKKASMNRETTIMKKASGGKVAKNMAALS